MKYSMIARTSRNEDAKLFGKMNHEITLRTTGYGFLSAVCRIGGILGSLTFGSFIGISRAIPMVTTAGVLVVGAFAALKLPETKDVLM
ncbi:unnamed protein product [Darwinula stevensoni]|uniref:Uncharacterized protein n=1 Tax=Darwinula stevensoni TaxID=69355 RepID=A0A7R8XC74_9CRUS|nr:unnamed protein product [Darwinula stevensoni]CAG0893508.1 unnamed protein product [Darwinula stevensoni]